ncbi:MAG: cupin domain-containing protein [Candidatus Faecousia sp.]|nr:cupin domain-containing protein [Bacillota bacterium]MDY4220093.1 cupin domain-containing protein [Candidatus Faecousia sp.]
MLFERTHSEVSNEFSATVCKSFSFPVHLHRSFEFFGVTRGMACVTVEEKEYTLSAGEAVLIFPYQTHAYANDNSADVVMLIFSPEMVPAFYNHTARKTPLSNLFTFPLE